MNKISPSASTRKSKKHFKKVFLLLPTIVCIELRVELEIDGVSVSRLSSPEGKLNCMLLVLDVCLSSSWVLRFVWEYDRWKSGELLLANDI